MPTGRGAKETCVCALTQDARATPGEERHQVVGPEVPPRSCRGTSPGWLEAPTQGWVHAAIRRLGSASKVRIASVISGGYAETFPGSCGLPPSAAWDPRQSASKCVKSASKVRIASVISWGYAETFPGSCGTLPRFVQTTPSPNRGCVRTFPGSRAIHEQRTAAARAGSNNGVRSCAVPSSQRRDPDGESRLRHWGVLWCCAENG